MLGRHGLAKSYAWQGGGDASGDQRYRNVLDFFAMDERLVASFVDVCVCVALGGKNAQTSGNKVKVRHLIYPKAFPRQRPIGPAREPPAYKEW